MSELRFEHMEIRGANLGPERQYPILYKQKMFEKPAELDEDDGLFINYGNMYHVLPYASLDTYDRALDRQIFDTAVLESGRLKAVFVPSLGGRLWSLYDKREGRDLVVNNPVFRPCNLALRNAWISGGIEWNCGIRGHSPLTCDRVYAAETKLDDATPVLRMYAFERIRAVTYQMDFFLKEDLPFLFTRMRIVNGSDRVTPIYWWSTTAVEQREGARVIVPADETYVNKALDPVSKTAIPFVNGLDLTYPTNHPIAIDHFYKIPEASRKYEAYVMSDGIGLMQASTRLLKGRKLFVWGMSRGGLSWQRFLTSEEGYAQPYVEIQAGLAATQNESLPMPPNTAWEWLEAYGPMRISPEEAHGDWQKSRAAALGWLDGALPEALMEKMLAETREMAKSPADMRFKGHPWGCVDNAVQESLGRRPASPHLDFGKPEPPQELWLRFLENGYLDEPDPESAPASYMVQEEWFLMLQSAVEGADASNWFAWHQLGLGYFARDMYRQAEEAFKRSLALKTSSWGFHALAAVARVRGRERESVLLMAKALERNPGHVPLAKEAMRFAYEAGEYRLLLSICDSLNGEARFDGTVRMYRAFGLAHTGREREARDILLEGGGLVITDMREGSDTLVDEYVFIERALAAKEGRELAAEDVKIPEALDFRMFNDTTHK